jgi:hypothetical protein
MIKKNSNKKIRTKFNINIKFRLILQDLMEYESQWGFPRLKKIKSKKQRKNKRRVNQLTLRLKIWDWNNCKKKIIKFNSQPIQCRIWFFLKKILVFKNDLKNKVISS